MMQSVSERSFLQRPLRTGDWVLVGVAIVSIGLSMALILARPGTPAAWQMDHSFTSTANLHIGRSNGFWVFQYPYLQHTGSITLRVIVGTY
jgi:hypothetical protein